MCQDVVYELVNVWSFQNGTNVRTGQRYHSGQHHHRHQPQRPSATPTPHTPPNWRRPRDATNLAAILITFRPNIMAAYAPLSTPKVTAKRTRSRVRGQRDYVFERNAHTHQRPPAAPPTSVRFACPRARGRATSNTGDIEIYFEITNKSA